MAEDLKVFMEALKHFEKAERLLELMFGEDFGDTEQAKKKVQEIKSVISVLQEKIKI